MSGRPSLQDGTNPPTTLLPKNDDAHRPMTSSASVSKTEFAECLTSAWRSKITPLRSPVFPQALVRGRGEPCIELGFLLSAEPNSNNPLVLRLKWADGRISASRDALAVEFGDWKHIP